MLAEVEKDRMEKFGKAGAKALKPVKDIFNEIISKMVKLYPIGSIDGERLKVCLATVKIYLENYLKNPSEDKFRYINLENNAFKNKVDSCLGGRVLLKEIGFVEAMDSKLFL